MKRNRIVLLAVVALALTVFQLACDGTRPPTADEKERVQQEALLKEGNAQTGMPNIVNFREKKMLKHIIELRDQDGLVTYTYLENLTPVVVPGKTALGGKLTFFGVTVGYGIPYATQYTNPQKVEKYSADSGGYTFHVIAQADPNGLFSPASAEGTWVLMKDPKSDNVAPIYVEPRCVVLPFKLPVD